MQSCYAGDCGRIEKVLADTDKTPFLILNELLTEKMQSIFQTDALNLVDVQEMYAKSGLKKNNEPVMNRFFHTPESYEEEPLPEIADVEEQLVVSEWPDPSEPSVIASLDSGEADDDKDASANG